MDGYRRTDDEDCRLGAVLLVRLGLPPLSPVLPPRLPAMLHALRPAEERPFLVALEPLQPRVQREDPPPVLLVHELQQPDARPVRCLEREERADARDLARGVDGRLLRRPHGRRGVRREARQPEAVLGARGVLEEVEDGRAALDGAEGPCQGEVVAPVGMGPVDEEGGEGGEVLCLEGRVEGGEELGGGGRGVNGGGRLDGWGELRGGDVVGAGDASLVRGDCVNGHCEDETELGVGVVVARESRGSVEDGGDGGRYIELPATSTSSVVGWTAGPYSCRARPAMSRGHPSKPQLPTGPSQSNQRATVRECRLPTPVPPSAPVTIPSTLPILPPPR